MRCGVSECCSCLSDPLIDLSVQGEVIGDCWSKVHELVIGIKLVVIDGDGWCGDCISCPITLFCLLQADSLLKVLERRVSSVTAILSGCELQLLRRQQTADLWWGGRATSRCLHPLWHWSHPGEQVVLSLGWSRLLMQDSCRMHLLCQWEPTMFGRTHCPDRVGLRWCSGIESGVIQNHRHCSPVSPCSASYSSLHLKSFSFSVPVPCFLQDDGDISIQSLELIVYDSPFPGIIDVLKIFRESQHQSPDVPTPQFKSWSLL